MNDMIDAVMLVKMFLAGAAYLENKKDLINELNVFPVPDGDTGTNMTLTIKSAVNEVENVGGEAGMKAVCKAMSSGSLRGARGNSGVILSQLIRGFSKVARDKDQLDTAILADAMDRAVETAYKAVMKPKEGTILTVAKGAAVKSRELAENGNVSLSEYFEEVVKEAEAVLEQTPEMLPVLKQAGVVDSGGAGLVEVLKGCRDAYLGKEITFAAAQEAAPEEAAGQEPEEIPFLYHTVIHAVPELSFTGKTEKDLNKFLQSMGDSVKIAQEDGQLRIKLNTNDPGMVIQRVLLLGELTDVRIRSLREGSAPAPDTGSDGSSKTAANEGGKGGESGTAPVKDPVPAPSVPEVEVSTERKPVGFIAVSVGEGIEEIFKGLGVDYVIAGGQTMNPCTADVLAAVDQVNADTVFILPNNKNIIMTANQAVDLCKDKKIIVIPTKTIPQGITAAINYMPDLDPETNRDNMIEEIKAVSTVEVTYAVRDTVIGDNTIHEGDIMGIGDDGILAVGAGIDDTAFDAVCKVITDETEIVSIYSGADVSEEEAGKLRDRIAEKYPDCDVEVQAGGQPIYYYILSAE